MTPTEEKQITRWNEGLAHEVQVRLMVTDDHRSGMFEQFCDDLVRHAPKVRILREQKDGKESLPVIEVSSGLRYHAVPLDRELAPFLRALEQREPDMPAAIREDLASLKSPVPLRLYIAPQCPFCPETVSQLIPLTNASDFIEIRIIDAGLFTEMAEADKVRSVPTLILNEQFRWSGAVKLHEVAEIVARQDPEDFSALTLERMVKEGDAARLAQMMVDKGTIFPAFTELLTHEKWPVRLGAMVAAETIADQSRTVAAGMVPLLWDRFDAADDAVRGDILYVLGVAGDSELIPRLKAVSQGPYAAEVREAAQEAIEYISETHSDTAKEER